MPSADHIAGCQWLPDEELAVYTEEFGRTGFQGGLQWYRCALAPSVQAELLLFAGRHIEVPSCFIAGARDWGVHQSPGALESMQTGSARTSEACTWSRGPGTGSNKSAAKRSPGDPRFPPGPDLLGPYILAIGIGQTRGMCVRRSPVQLRRRDIERLLWVGLMGVGIPPDGIRHRRVSSLRQVGVAAAPRAGGYVVGEAPDARLDQYRIKSGQARDGRPDRGIQVRFGRRHHAA